MYLKKGYTLVETLVSVVIISSLLVISSSILLKGFKYKIYAQENYDQELELYLINQRFISLTNYYKDCNITQNDDMLMFKSKIIYYQNNETLYFNLESLITLDVRSNIIINLKNDHLLEVDVIQDGIHTIYCYYLGG